MKKLLIICGATGTGKTSLGIYLANKFGGEIISADSRQVYIGMDIGTGKDIPKNSTYKKNNQKTGGYYQIGKTKIWGYDLISPKSEFSVAQYTRIAREIIKDIHKRKKLAILVGGTGFYIKSIVNGIETSKIPQNKALRKNIQKLSTNELFEKIAQLDPIKAGSLNQSDRKNPRRLIRAIEIATWKLNNTGVVIKDEKRNYDVLFIGLNLPKGILFEKIKSRVEKRINGIKKEILGLLRQGVSWSDQSMSSLGYRQWKEYFEAEESQEKAVLRWFSEEKKYSRRQITWFKKCRNINWFDISEAGWREDVEKKVKKWYSSN